MLASSYDCKIIAKIVSYAWYHNEREITGQYFYMSLNLIGWIFFNLSWLTKSGILFIFHKKLKLNEHHNTNFLSLDNFKNPIHLYTKI